MGGGPEGTELDIALLGGFGFACRPDCGLCCYAEPRVRASERKRLLEIAPEAEFVGTGSDVFIASRADGGACQFLEENRCRVHDARPHPCREFPLTAHVGTRVQVTVVLSCPGVDLSPLVHFHVRADETRGTEFASELAALRERVDSRTSRRLDASRRRRRKIAKELESSGRWEEETEVRDRLRGEIPLPTAEDFPVADPPSPDDGVELLPLFFDQRSAPVALAEGLGGWELHEISPVGGFARTLGVVPAPDRPAEMTSDAAALLRGYLSYWLERDAFFGAVHLRMIDSADGTVTEWAYDELRAIGALTLARAEVRAKFARGSVDRLDVADLANGIRATDQDLLDRDSWGERL
ncbi:MAG: YkgJ family cysteine cluster protein [Thermoplasmata archaeon]